MIYYNNYTFISRFSPYLPLWDAYECTLSSFGRVPETK